MLKKNNFSIPTLLLLGITSCSGPNVSYQGSVEIPSGWYSPISSEMAFEDSWCFLWWEAFNDPILTSLILEAPYRNQDVLTARLGSKNLALKAVNDVTAEVARNYIEFRGLQLRLKILDENIEAQQKIVQFNTELSNKGFFGVEKENEDKRNLEALLMQRPLLHFSIEKIVLHLATLLNYTPCAINERLCSSQGLPDLIEESSIGCPSDLICHNPAVRVARQQYRSKGGKQLLYNYQKVVLETLESAQTALAAYNYQRDRIYYLESARNLKAESYEITKDLNNRGSKDDRDALIAYQELLSEEDSIVQGKVDLLISYINLYHTTSCAWEVPCN